MNYLNLILIEFLEKHHISQIIGYILFYSILACIIFAILLLMILALVLIERKLLGYFTQRKGPNRVGFWGILQTLADALKLLCKENITPIGADKFLFNLAPILMFMPVLVVLGIIPYSSEFTFMNFDTNILLFMIFSIFPILSILIAGYSSNNKYSLLGAVRNVSQILAYELPLIFTLISIMVLSSSMNLTQIIMAQNTSSGMLSWFIFPCIIGFFILFTATLAELNRCPFDLPEAESELICGYNTEYSGMRFALFYLSEYGLMFANSIFISILFLGGYLSPFGKYLSPMIVDNQQLANIMICFEQAFWLLLKSFLIIFFIILIRATFPRMASFDLLKLSWSVLLPISILNVLLMVLIKLFTGGFYA